MAVERISAVVGAGAGGRYGRDWRLDETAQRVIVARVAVQALDRVQDAGEFPTDPEQYITKVNNKLGHGREWRVQLRGPLSKVITYIRYDEGVDWTKAAKTLLEMVFRRSPYDRKKPWDRASGVPFRRRHYAESFLLLRDGRTVARPGRGFLAQAFSYLDREGGELQPGDTLALVNIQPYARRIEEGWSVSVPRGVLKLAARSRALKTDILFKRFEYRPLPAAAAAEIESQGAVATYAERRKDKRTGWQYSGRIMRKHRIYPVLWFGPPSGSGEARMARTNREWSNRPDIYATAARVPGLAGVRGPRRRGDRMRNAPVQIRRTFQEPLFHGHIQVRSR